MRHHVVHREAGAGPQPLRRADHRASATGSGAPIATRLMKENLNRATERTIEQTLEAEAITQSLSFASEDTREAVIAWVEKRDPVFKGR